MVNQTEMSTSGEAETSNKAKPEGAVGAAFIASGIGSLVLGLAIVISEISTDVRSFFTWNDGVGPLSGKTGIAVIAFIVSWVILHYVFRERPLKLATSFYISIVLIALGLLLSFPPVFLLFES